VSRLSRQCGILNISQPYRPPRPATRIALLFYFIPFRSSSISFRFLLSHSKSLHEKVRVWTWIKDMDFDKQIKRSLYKSTLWLYINWPLLQKILYVLHAIHTLRITCQISQYVCTKQIYRVPCSIHPLVQSRARVNNSQLEMSQRIEIFQCDWLPLALGDMLRTYVCTLVSIYNFCFWRCSNSLVYKCLFYVHCQYMSLNNNNIFLVRITFPFSFYNVSYANNLGL
jgi:hypothetical protein